MNTSSERKNEPNTRIKVLLLLLQERLSASTLAARSGIMYVNNIYPTLRALEKEELIQKDGSTYKINDKNPRIRSLKEIKPICKDKTAELLTDHTKKVLEIFTARGIVRKSDIPSTHLSAIEDLAERYKILHAAKEDKSTVYFIRPWEHTTQLILRFFEITLLFDQDEHEAKIKKFYISRPRVQRTLVGGDQLRKENEKMFAENKEFILDKLKNLELPDLAVVDVVTKQKIEEITSQKSVGGVFSLPKRLEDWKVKYVYNSDSIEGNPLTLSDVRTILTLGIQNLEDERREVLETTNTKRAIDFVLKGGEELSEEFILTLHRLTQQYITDDAGKYKIQENGIFSEDGKKLIDTTTPVEHVARRMETLVRWYHLHKERLHPFVLAAVIHNQLLYIHPFSDGNGRVGRLLLNHILYKNGYFPIIFWAEEKGTYYEALKLGHDGDIRPLLNYIMSKYREQLTLF